MVEQLRGEHNRGCGLPEENLLYFSEKHAPMLEGWERELCLDRAATIAQYYYPQKQTKMMNEGCATFVHYHVMNRLHEKGLLSDGFDAGVPGISHTSVVFQPEYDDPRYSGINPYALGYAMMADIKRICLKPTEEDRAWFSASPAMATSTAWLRDAWANYRDESFILQFFRRRFDPQLPGCSASTTMPPSRTCWSTPSMTRRKAIKEIRNSRFSRAPMICPRREPDIQVIDVAIWPARPPPGAGALRP